MKKSEVNSSFSPAVGKNRLERVSRIALRPKALMVLCTPNPGGSGGIVLLFGASVTNDFPVQNRGPTKTFHHSRRKTSPRKRSPDCTSGTLTPANGPLPYRL